MRYDGKKLMEARLAKGWDQTETAYRAGVSVSTISRVESGDRQRPPTIKKIAKVLGVRLRDIMVSDTEAEPAGARR
jgi:transcriptional regulator with XRE-family HTH domain